MGIIGGMLGYRILKRVSPSGAATQCDESAYAGGSKLSSLLGESFLEEIRNRVVIDFGCGLGAQAIEMAQRGAKKVIGIDVQEQFVEAARKRAVATGVADVCSFTIDCTERADVIVAIDSFEHFADPAAVLQTMRALVNPGGCIFVSFGPTWYHPLGGHLFSVFPWAHLLFTERALLRWRADFKHDEATTFQEVDGGLNQMTIRRFERLVAESDFTFQSFETIPIRGLRMLSNRLTREFTTAIVRCKLVI